MSAHDIYSLPKTYGHPFWHLCRKCIGPVKVFVYAGILNIFWEFVSFLPTHEFFEWVGWLN